MDKRNVRHCGRTFLLLLSLLAPTYVCPDEFVYVTPFIGEFLEVLQQFVVNSKRHHFLCARSRRCAMLARALFLICCIHNNMHLVRVVRNF